MNPKNKNKQIKITVTFKFPITIHQILPNSRPINGPPPRILVTYT